MNWITGVKYNAAETQIVAVEVRADQGGTMGLPTRATRGDVIAAIDRGTSYVTAYERQGRWIRGEDVRIVSIGHERFLRTDRNAVRADNLGNLPRIA